MPLRDHFHPPLANLRSWEELHGAWPGTIAFRLNTILPTGYYSGVRVHVGPAIEVDIATFEEPSTRFDNHHDGTNLGWQPTEPLLLAERDIPTQAEYEVLVYDERHGRRLVAAVEIVSPSNKDRLTRREAFIEKCDGLLQQGICVVIVDLVTERSGNLYAELAQRLGAGVPAIAAHSIYAVTLRGRISGERQQVEVWEHALAIGAALPTLPLFLDEVEYVPLELELTYEDTCRGLRIR